MDIGAHEIDVWHKAKPRSWSGIGYHFVIRRNGDLETGRKLEMIGAHARGHNEDTLGICMIGGMHEEDSEPEMNFTDEQFVMLDKLVSGLQMMFSIPQTGVLGHRDLPEVDKQCPCFDVHEWFVNDDIHF